MAGVIGAARAAALAALLAVTLPAGVRAVDADFGEPTATASWGEGMAFTQPVTLGEGVRRVEVLIDVPEGDGPTVIEVETEPPAGQRNLRHALELGHTYPNTVVTARWRVVGEDGTEVVGPPVTVRMEDDRFEWRVREGDIVRVHWYEGGDEFGDRALAIGEQALAETQELLGVTEEDPVDFFIYADQQAFYDALGPGTRENVGGVALAQLRTLFALIPPAEIDDEWVGIVIPHEMVHLVFDTATDNPYHFPPRWLNEGVAVYRSQGYELGDRAAVQQAVDDGSLIPLEGLTGQFPTTRERFFLAYAESVAAVDFLIRQHGPDALVNLVRSYATGLTDDEAFEQAIGMDVAAFDAAWRAELGVGEPTVHGPQPAPPGPLPPGWTTAEGSPGATLPPGSRPTAAPGAPASPTPGSPVTGDDRLPLAIAAVAAVGVTALALYVLVVRRRSGELEPAVEPAAADAPAGSGGDDPEATGERAAVQAGAPSEAPADPPADAPAHEPRREP